MSGADIRHLRLALGLAPLGRGRVEPNPVVGCAIVRDGVVLGRGWHRRYGGPHAEIEALRGAGEAARGADVFISLEPCGHHGKTPPCAEALVRAGVSRVVYAAADLNPLTRGRGLRLLAEAGIPAVPGGLEAEASALNVRFERWLTSRRPWVLLKWGASLDGRVADAAGGSRYITGEASRRLVHEIRGAVDAILVGSGTVLADDPDLTCRLAGGASPRRIVLDGRLRTPPGSRLATTAHAVPTTIVTRPGAGASARAALEACGCEVVEVESSPEERLGPVLERLRDEGIHRVLLEGGPTVSAAALREGVVDQVLAFQAPVILGGARAPGPAGGEDGVSTVAGPLRLADLCVTRHGEDVLVEGFLDDPGSAVPGRRPGRS